MRKIVTLSFCIVAALVASSQTYNVVDFGATTDSAKLNTKAIQSAIDACAAKGGGEVMVPAGTFYTGTVFLRSNVYLHLLPGAVLQGSYNPADYPEHNILVRKKYGTIVHNGLYVDWLKAIIIADSAQNTGIFGQGTVKGAGEGRGFQLGENKNGKPLNILFIGCHNVSLKDIRVLNSAQVTVSISDCENVVVDGIYVNSLVNWNTDGMDIDGRNVTVSNCIIDSEDDALCFKSEYLGKFCENVTVTNCVVASNCNGIKLGTGSRTGFRNVTVSNCVIKRPSKDDLRKWNRVPGIFRSDIVTSVNTGIVILGVDGGLVENVNFSGIVMTDVATPFTLRAGKRFLTPEGKPSVMRRIRLQNITAQSISVIPSVIAGVADSPIEDVKLSNVQIINTIGVSADSLKTFPSTFPEAEKRYPENRMFGLKLPGSAFYARHVKGLTFDDVAIMHKDADARPAFYLDDASAVRMRRVQVDDRKFAVTKRMVYQTGSQITDIQD